MVVTGNSIFVERTFGHKTIAFRMEQHAAPEQHAVAYETLLTLQLAH